MRKLLILSLLISAPLAAADASSSLPKRSQISTWQTSLCPNPWQASDIASTNVNAAVNIMKAATIWYAQGQQRAGCILSITQYLYRRTLTNAVNRLAAFVDIHVDAALQECARQAGVALPKRLHGAWVDHEKSWYCSIYAWTPELLWEIARKSNHPVADDVESVALESDDE